MGLVLPLFQWTKTGNYPAGGFDWSSQPLALKPAGTYWTPENIPDAEDLNWIMGTQAADVSAVFQAAAGMQAQNWPIQVTVIGNTIFQGSNTLQALMGACWHPLDRQWWFIAKEQNGANDFFTVWSTQDGVNYMNFVSSSSGLKPLENVTPDQYFVAITPDPTTSNKVWVSYVDTTNPNTGLLYTVAGASWNAVGSYVAGASTCRVSLHTFNGHVLQGYGSTGSNLAGIYRDSGPMVVGISPITAVAIAFADNTGNSGPGNLCVAIPALSTSPGPYWTSPDGVTWTAQTWQLVGGGTVPGLGTMYPFGICWTQDAQGPCWLIGFQSGAEPIFYRSSDGINWSLQAQPTGFSNPIGTCMTMAACGSVIIVTGSDGAQGAYSLDGGVTWYATPQASWAPSSTYTSGNNPTTSYYTPNSVIANNNQFALFNSVGMKWSLGAGLGTAIN